MRFPWAINSDPTKFLRPSGRVAWVKSGKPVTRGWIALVAIKTSKAQFSERFAREARAIAALNHPHICQLYDVGPDYLVMEYVEGSPLKGPLPMQKAVEYAGQILSALDAAHRKGIIHRDLKPAQHSGHASSTGSSCSISDWRASRPGSRIRR